MNQPKISVIVPVYNVEKYLRQCVDSILVQTFTDFELLLIDDGSTDSSGKLCDEYAEKDARIKVLHQKNGGVGSARNLGLNQAQGEWVCFVDSDDWLDRNCYSALMAETYVADLTYFGCCCCYMDGSRTAYIPYDSYSTDRNQIEQRLYELKCNQQCFEYLGYTWNKLFKKDIIDRHKIRFIENLTVREDEMFTLSYARYIGSIRIKSCVLYNYRVISTGLTHAMKSAAEYLLLAENLWNVLSSYRNEKLIQSEYGAILNYYYIPITREKLGSSGWMNSVKRLMQFSENCKTIPDNATAVIRISFYKKNKLYRYFIISIFHAFHDRYL